jgi:uncharacterized protein
MRVVLDTNILVSALLWRGAPHRCLLAVQAGLADLVVSPPILDELRVVLMTKFQFTVPDADEAVTLIRAAADMVEISGQLRVVADDPDDDKFVETARTGRAEIIVSGDRHLLALGSGTGVPVFTAREFLDRLAGGSA